MDEYCSKASHGYAMKTDNIIGNICVKVSETMSQYHWNFVIPGSVEAHSYSDLVKITELATAISIKQHDWTEFYYLQVIIFPPP